MRRAILALALSAVSFDAYAHSFRIGGELGLYHDDVGLDQSITILTQVLDADITLFDTFALAGSLPFVEAIGSGEDRFRIGNPSVAAYYQMGGDLLKFRIGGGLAIPAAQIGDDDVASIFVHLFALAMHGFQRPWMYAPEVMPVMVPSARLSLDLSLVTIDAGADCVILIPLNDGQDTEVLFPLTAGAMVHLWFLGVGAEIGASFMPTNSFGAEDKAQISFSPRITATFAPVELEARLTMNLDDPFGFSFDEGGVWGFFLGVHAVF